MSDVEHLFHMFMSYLEKCPSILPIFLIGFSDIEVYELLIYFGD